MYKDRRLLGLSQGSFDESWIAVLGTSTLQGMSFLLPWAKRALRAGSSQVQVAGGPRQRMASQIVRINNQHHTVILVHPIYNIYNYIITT